MNAITGLRILTGLIGAAAGCYHYRLDVSRPLLLPRRKRSLSLRALLVDRHDFYGLTPLAMKEGDMAP